MNLSIADTRLIIDALEFKLAHLEQQQAQLGDSQLTQIAELSNDIYTMELLRDALQEEYQREVNLIDHSSHKPADRHSEKNRQHRKYPLKRIVKHAEHEVA